MSEQVDTFQERFENGEQKIPSRRGLRMSEQVEDTFQKRFENVRTGRRYLPGEV